MRRFLAAVLVSSLCWVAVDRRFFASPVASHRVPGLYAGPADGIAARVATPGMRRFDNFPVDEQWEQYYERVISVENPQFPSPSHFFMVCATLSFGVVAWLRKRKPSWGPEPPAPVVTWLAAQREERAARAERHALELARKVYGDSRPA
jgi:hypothetical protein